MQRHTIQLDVCYKNIEVRRRNSFQHPAPPDYPRQGRKEIPLRQFKGAAYERASPHTRAAGYNHHQHVPSFLPKKRHRRTALPDSLQCRAGSAYLERPSKHLMVFGNPRHHIRGKLPGHQAPDRINASPKLFLLSGNQQFQPLPTLWTARTHRGKYAQQNEARTARHSSARRYARPVPFPPAGKQDAAYSASRVHPHYTLRLIRKLSRRQLRIKRAPCRENIAAARPSLPKISSSLHLASKTTALSQEKTHQTGPLPKKHCRGAAFPPAAFATGNLSLHPFLTSARRHHRLRNSPHPRTRLRTLCFPGQPSALPRSSRRIAQAHHPSSRAPR